MNIVYIPAPNKPKLSKKDLSILSSELSFCVVDISSIPQDLLAFFAPGADTSGLTRFASNGFPVCLVPSGSSFVTVELKSRNPLDDLSSYRKSVFTSFEKEENVFPDMAIKSCFEEEETACPAFR